MKTKIYLVAFYENYTLIETWLCWKWRYLLCMAVSFEFIVSEKWPIKSLNWFLIFSNFVSSSFSYCSYAKCWINRRRNSHYLLGIAINYFPCSSCHWYVFYFTKTQIAQPWDYDTCWHSSFKSVFYQFIMNECLIILWDELKETMVILKKFTTMPSSKIMTVKDLIFQILRIMALLRRDFLLSHKIYWCFNCSCYRRSCHV